MLLVLGLCFSLEWWCILELTCLVEIDKDPSYVLLLMYSLYRGPQLQSTVGAWYAIRIYTNYTFLYPLSHQKAKMIEKGDKENLVVFELTYYTVRTLNYANYLVLWCLHEPVRTHSPMNQQILRLTQFKNSDDDQMTVYYTTRTGRSMRVW